MIQGPKSFSEYISIKYSNEAEIVAIPEVLRMYVISVLDTLIAEKRNAISWYSGETDDRWKFHYYLN